MFHRGRTIFIVICAVAGALASATWMPFLLDSVFKRLWEMNRPPISTAVDNAQLPPETKRRVENIQDDSQLPAKYEGARKPSVIFAMALLGLIVGAALGSIFLRLGEGFNRRWDKMATGDKVTLFLGIFSGIVASSPFLFVFQSLGVVGPIITLSLTVGLSAFSIYALRSMDDALPWQRSGGKRRKTGIKVLDTNVLIDGRIYDLVRTGFIEGELYVPKFVLHELQHIADSPDSMRRLRGRRGLEILRHIQAEHPVEIGTHDRFAPDESEEVDSRLVRVAKALGGDLVSNDFNLNRVASLQDVRVLNINDLALALRPNVLPGETLEVAVIREGNQNGQGVGYLDDGTMVVVEGGRALIGTNTRVNVTQVIQTERGKMIFADAPDDATSGDDYSVRRSRSRGAR